MRMFKLLTVLSLFLSASCSKDATSDAPIEIEFSIDDPKVVGGEFIVTDASYFGNIVLKSNSNLWSATATPQASWLTIREEMHGESNRLRVEIEENTGFDPRSSEITFHDEGNRELASFTLTQLGSRKTVAVPESALKQSLSIEGGRIEIPVVANTEYDISFEPTAAVSWVSRVEAETAASGTRAVPTTENRIGFEIAENTTEEPRTCEIVFTGRIAEGDSGESAPEVRVCVTQEGPAPEEYPTFIIFSDIHFDRTSAGMTAVERCRKLLGFLTAKAGTVDAVFVTGDYTDSGSDEQYDHFLSVIKDPTVLSPDIPVYCALGNHDYYTGTIEESHERYKSKFGKESLHAYEIIKGYPFIVISIDHVDNAELGRGWYSQQTVDWVTQCLADAAEKCPGKPIFIFSHIPVEGTVPFSGGRANSSTQFKALFEQYPQIVFFSGHEHTSLANPRGIFQDKFTAIDTSTGWAATVDANGLNAWPVEGQQVMEGIVARVEENGDVTIEKWDALRGEEITPPWVIKAPHDGTAFGYAGRTGGDGPVFTTSSPVISKISENGCRVTWTQATDEDRVFYYKVETYNTANDQQVSSNTVFSCYFWNSGMPSELQYDLTGLVLGESYYVRIYAYDLFHNQSSACIQSEPFTTHEYEPDPGVTVPTADLFDVHFVKEGAVDRSPLANPVETGAVKPATAFDAAINSYVSTFTSAKEDHFKLWYKDKQSMKDALSNSFTMEAYYRARNNGSSVLGFMQGGGGGYYQVSGKPAFYLYLDGAWSILTSTAAMNAEEYYHVIFTYDRSSARMTAYVNGAPAGGMDAPGTLSFPASPSAQFFGIGCDSNVNTVDYPLDGDVAFVRFYSHEVNEDEVYLLYRQIRERKKLTNLQTLVNQLEYSMPAKEMAATGEEKAAIREAIDDGWRLVNDFAATQQQIDNAIARNDSFVLDMGDYGKPGGSLDENDLNNGGGSI